MDKVRDNLDALERKLIKANKIAAKGEKMKVGDAIKLGRKSSSMAATINKGMKEYDDTDPTPQESKEMLAQMTRIVELTEEQVNSLIGCSGYLKDKLHVGGLVKRNLVKTAEASEALSHLMVSKAPPELKEEGQALAKRRNVAFDKALAVYGNATGGDDLGDGAADDSD
ncbi:hypothetical protein PG994_008646 [Apiospora phragmitis]|uniref:Terminase small subunit n=1 Tax=Apiospora phragmitis TaxID=2905665 RepID=A0ABR1UH21_9PEZI